MVTKSWMTTFTVVCLKNIKFTSDTRDISINDSGKGVLRNKKCVIIKTTVSVILKITADKLTVIDNVSIGISSGCSLIAEINFAFCSWDVSPERYSSKDSRGFMLADKFYDTVSLGKIYFVMVLIVFRSSLECFQWDVRIRHVHNKIAKLSA
ncbi:hypothetical protein CWS02_04940 [Enterobacter sp. EA-1]|nr:hypothetical protein CWS02_04940 [Enterobacter sp. EA-1]